MNLPKRPILMTMGRLQLGQTSSVGLIGLFHLDHLDAGFLESRLEGGVELSDGVFPRLFALGNLVQFLFHVGGEVGVDDRREMSHQHRVHCLPSCSGCKRPSLVLT